MVALKLRSWHNVAFADAGFVNGGCSQVSTNLPLHFGVCPYALFPFIS